MKKTDLPKVYVDSCCFIDMVTHDHSKGESLNEERENLVWFYKRFLKISRDEEIWVYTAGITKDECLFIKSEDGNRNMDEETKRLYKSVFDSDKSGVTVVYEEPFISDVARDLIWDDSINMMNLADRIHMATAIQMRCDEFITCDGRDFLNKTQVKEYLNDLGIKVIKASDTTILPPRLPESLFE